MASKGVFAVSREIWDDPDFADEPFTQREAWMWLIGAACWKDQKVRGANGPVALKRSEFCFSVRFLAGKFQWSKSRASRFLDMLKNRDSIKDTSRDSEKVYLIKNYNEFQVVGLPKRDTERDAARDSSGTVAGQHPGQRRNNKHSNNTPSGADKSAHEAITETVWRIAPAKLIKLGMREGHARSFIGKCLKQSRPADVLEAIDKAARNGTPEPAKYVSKALQNNSRPKKLHELSTAEREQRILDSI